MNSPGPSDAKPDKRQQNPVVRFLDKGGVAKNDLVHDDVVCVFPFIRYGTPPRFVVLGFWKRGSEDVDSVCRFSTGRQRQNQIVHLLCSNVGSRSIECLMSVWHAEHSSGSAFECCERWSTENAGRPLRRSSATSCAASSASRLWLQTL